MAARPQPSKCFMEAQLHTLRGFVLPALGALTLCMSMTRSYAPIHPSVCPNHAVGHAGLPWNVVCCMLHVSSRRSPLLALHLAAGARTHACADSPTHAFTCGTCSPAAHSFNVRVRVLRASSCAACVDERVRCSMPNPGKGWATQPGLPHPVAMPHITRKVADFAIVGSDCRRNGLFPTCCPPSPHSVTENRMPKK